jgi:hypothetical protein
MTGLARVARSAFVAIGVSTGGAVGSATSSDHSTRNEIIAVVGGLASVILGPPLADRLRRKNVDESAWQRKEIDRLNRELEKERKHDDTG